MTHRIPLPGSDVHRVLRKDGSHLLKGLMSTVDEGKGQYPAPSVSQETSTMYAAKRCGEQG
ncbi:hypothetical protein M513_13804 [Trichuris suis]|uniref:Uncharacterized protein n=1 Tax=Trichuris suis TaxID=68888 RepID=A0A085LK23_9BILA|nr:hypothetical protein M513_13804 [Trichuris suis]